MATQDQRLKQNARILSLAAAAIVLGFSATFFGLWIFGSEHLVVEVTRVIKPNTAFALLLASSAAGMLAMPYFDRHPLARRRIVDTLSSLVAAVGLSTFAQYVLGVDLGIDEFFRKDVLNEESARYPGRMAPNAALSFALSGISIVLIQANTRVSKRIASVLLSLAFILSAIALIGYLYQASALYQVFSFIRISQYSAGAFILLVFSILFSHPGMPPTDRILGSGPEGVLLRRLLPAALLIPIFLCWLSVQARNNEIVNRATGYALLAVSLIVLFSILIWIASSAVMMIDAERRKSVEKEKEALEDSIRQRDEFLSIASHELRTPVTSLMLQAQLRLRTLGRTGLQQDLPKLTKIANDDLRQIQRIALLIDDMLDISKISLGRLELNRESAELSEIVSDVLERHRFLFEASGNEVELQILKKVHGYWDRLRLEQVITNLFTNATRYGKGKPVRVTIDQVDGSAQLVVEDHGIGIAPENHERIFQRFERAIPASEISGLGLGLYITKRIVDLHDGTIRVESELGRGSRFIVSLPANAR